MHTSIALAVKIYVLSANALSILFQYINNKNEFNGIEFGLLFMTNM